MEPPRSHHLHGLLSPSPSPAILPQVLLLPQLSSCPLTCPLTWNHLVTAPALPVGAPNGAFTAANFSTSWLPWTQLSVASFKDALSSCSIQLLGSLLSGPQTFLWKNPSTCSCLPRRPPNAVPPPIFTVVPSPSERELLFQARVAPPGFILPSSSHQQQVGQPGQGLWLLALPSQPALV